MKITSYKNLYQINYLGFVNCYLYEEQASLTLIDIGVASFVKSIVALSKKLNKPVTHILLTHPHGDHIAGLPALIKEFPEAKIYLSERDSALLQGDFSLRDGEDATKIKGGFPKIDILPNYLLQDGKSIGSLTAIASSGHTPGSFSFYNGKSGILIAGDALQTKTGVAVSGDKRFFFPFPAYGTWSKLEALKSAKKLYQLDLNLLATGHGPILEKPKNQLKSAIERAEKNFKEITYEKK
ncbi:MBL fold metallo-hydrolase [Carnobacterium gallinarum]|uniref:MBL fold metallo-hydrolase n=1 Tax=Carnobacterium gallinarum TaxID=2749 RepID=UPI000558C8CB|nr:MBL fold metallo-hydrolase [Carnobacterium gallinarum]